MRKSFGANAYCYPMPVLMLAVYDEKGGIQMMNAAWGGISGSAEMTLCVSPGHRTVKEIRRKKEFTISMGDAAHVTECDYLGIVSGNDVPDKVTRAGFYGSAAAHVDAPVIDELPMTLECRLKSYDEESHHLVAEIVDVCADESILGSDGSIDPALLRPITYDPVNHTYRVLGEVVGTAFGEGEKLK